MFGIAVTPRQRRAEKKAALKTLTGSRKLLSKPERWTKGAYYGNKASGNGGKADGFVNHEDAFTYCAIGAIRKVDGPGERAAKKLLALAISALYYKNKRTTEDRVFRFNDKKNTTHEQILAAFDKAIEMALAEADALEAELTAAQATN
jgi:hypothetical protein